MVPVINENDTVATDEITFGDNDFLAAQVAIMLEARLLVLLTNTDGVFTADPGANPDAELITTVEDFSDLAGHGHRRPHLGLRQRRHAQQGCRGRDGFRVRASKCGSATAPSTAACGRRRPVNPPALVHRPQAARLRFQAVAQVREAVDRPDRGRRRRGQGAQPERLEPAAGRRDRGGGRFEAGDAVEVVASGVVIGKGIANYSAEEADRIKGMKSKDVLDLMPQASEELVHRDYFVLA